MKLYRGAKMKNRTLLLSSCYSCCLIAATVLVWLTDLAATCLMVVVCLGGIMDSGRSSKDAFPPLF